MGTRNIRQPVRKGAAKVPVIMQMEALECGAACLAMVMAYYDKWVPMEQARLDCGVSRDGSNARNILVAARSYGFEAQAYRYSLNALKTQAEFPCIIHWNFNHFVVLDGFTKGGSRVRINDPARGALTLPVEELDRSFTGVVLIIRPGPDFEPSGKPQSMAAYAAKRLRGAGAAVLFITLTAVVGYLFGVINPVMAQIFMDRLLTGRNPDWLYPFVGALAFFNILQLIVAWANAIYTLRINGKLAVTGSMAYMWKVLRLPMEFFTQRMAGDIQSRQATNASIASTLVNTLAPLVLNTAMMVIYLVLMLRYSVVLTAVGLVSVLLNLLLSQYIAGKRVNLTRVQLRDAAKLAGATVSGVQMIETIKAAGAENGFFRKWSGYQASVNAQKVKYAELDAVLGGVPALIGNLADYAVIVVGVWLVMNGAFRLGMIMTFQSFLNQFLAPATSLISAGQTIQEMRASMERVEDVMRYPEDRCFREDTPADADYGKLQGDVELRHVTFGYSRLAPPLIEDFSMHLKPGSRVALVGASGCGKSTLSKLISGLYQPWSGEILFDGRPMGEIDRSVFTGSVAVVDQDIILFEDTIAGNVRMWDDTIEDYELILAARDAQIYDDILQRQGGFRYKITEGGKDFSGGQRQRLEIARVLSQDPTVIILDEATSALDAKTEYEAVNAIRDRGITCIVIAHRLSTIRDCDEIIVLDHGKVVERGTHEELYAKGGIYTELISNE